ncbi:FHA domain-containing protein [Kitasatospora sp. NPDC057692]|uniref:FHA domain-containing protein n=1 Tax=Kitasatospora sp. NPDC057692 TaxID=3346215 RepID=UPI00368BD70A
MSPPSQDQVLPRLIVDNPDRIRGRSYVLDHDPLVVGRDSTCGLQLVDPLLSRRHAMVWWAGGHTTVEDLSSTNGTRLNGQRVLGQQILRSGDVLSFGPLEVHYEEPADAATKVAEKDPEVSALLTGEDPPAPRHRGEAAPTPHPRPQPQLATAQEGTAPPEQAARRKEPPKAKPPPGPADPPRPSAPPYSPPPRHRARAPQSAQYSQVLQASQVPQASKGSPDSQASLPRLNVPPRDAPRFDVNQQRAKGNLSNIGRDQVNYIWQDDHLQVARRETFFRKIATTRIWARHVLVTGLALALLGSAFLGWEGSNPDVLGDRIQGIAHSASVVLGVTGVLLLVFGCAVLIRSVIRQRRYEREEERRLNPDPDPSPSG